MARFGLDWVERKPPSGTYNCAGHVWACRRTAIYDDLENQVETIFKDDSYRLFKQGGEALSIGDLVVYWDRTSGKKLFLHVGVIAEIRMLAGSVKQVPWVLSKWDDTSGEVLHNCWRHPFEPPVDVEFWTDRP